MSVKRFSIEELSNKGSNIYATVRTLAQRAVEISRGAHPLLLHPKSQNAVTIALEEMMANKIEIKTTVKADLDQIDEEN